MVAPRFEITTFCAPGLPPNGVVKIKPVGRMSGPGLLPAGSALSTMVITCGVLSAPAALIWTCP